MANFESHHGHFPSGGWGYVWAPHPGRGVGREQPGSWAYVLLPFIEQEGLRDLGKTADPLSMSAPQASNTSLYETPISIWMCPTRRDARLYPMKSAISFVKKPYLCGSLTEIALSDYAASAGTVIGHWGAGPGSLAAGDKEKGTSGAYQWPHDRNPPATFTGIMTSHDFVTMQDITDGTSNTYMVGEKYVWPEEYYSAGPNDLGDDQGPYNSDERDTVRYVIRPPKQEQPNTPYNGYYTWDFGSAHAGSLNMGMCDGSVRVIEYDIDLEIHQRLGNREDGLPVDL
jgi:prepilin-type processing-associated H-X9-DG protein